MEAADRQLVIDVKGGDRAAFTRLVDRFRGRVYALALAIMNDHASALELARDTFVRAHKELPKLGEADRFPSWIARLTYAVGREKRHERFEDSEAELQSSGLERSGGNALPVEGVTLATPFQKGEAELALVDALLSAQPERVRVAIDLRFREGLSYADIAETLDIPRTQVQQLLARGTKKLKGKLRPFLRRGTATAAAGDKERCAEAEPLLAALLDRELSTRAQAAQRPSEATRSLQQGASEASDRSVELGDEKARVEEHLASCPKCVEAREDLAALGDLLRRHFAARGSAIVTANVLRALEDEVTEAIVRFEANVPHERAQALTEPGPAPVRPPTPRSGTPRSGVLDDARRLMGAVLGGYRIDGEIAKGGMGTVFRATQLSMQRTVALKVLSRKFAVDETFVKRFVREARASATIEHPNVIKVYDAGEDKGDTFFAMELVEGDDAETLVLRNGPFPSRRAAEIALEVARALEAAHARGVVHRDVKPANVLVVRASGAVKLADLGLAKLQETEKDGHLTLRRVVMGSPNYMPPEQARDARDTDQRSDVYSLGATLHHLVTGERPWGGGTAVEIIARVVGAAPLPVPEKAKDGTPLEPGIRAILARACQKDRNKRYPSAQALREDLELFLSDRPRPKKTSKTLPARKLRRGSSGELPALVQPAWRRFVVPAGTAVLCLGAALLAFRKSRDNPARDTAVATSDSSAVSSLPSPVVTQVATVADTAADRLAYEELVREGDRLRSTDKLGDVVALYEGFVHTHSSSSQGARARRELQELRDKIAQRLQADLERAEQLASKNDFEGAEEVLTSIDFYGDDAARTRGRSALDALRARAKTQPTEKPPEEQPPAAPPPPAPPPPPAQVEKQPDEGSLLGSKVDLTKVLTAKVEALPGARTRLLYDWSAASQLEDWPVLAREPAWLVESLESLPLSAPYPYDLAKPWTLVKGSLYGQGFERRATRAVFAKGPLKVEVLGKLLTGHGLVVTLGDPRHPFVVAVAPAAPEGSFAGKPARTKEQQDALSKLVKKWKSTFSKPSIVVARELEAFDWAPTAPLEAFHPDQKGTHLTVEALSDDDGDALVVTVDTQRQRISLGKNALGAGPVGIETFGRPAVFESITIEGTADPNWTKTLTKER